MVDIEGELRSSTRSAWWGALGNLLLTVLKISVGILGHSRALIADGVHSGADLVSSLAVVVGLRVSRIPPDAGHNYGHAKAEAVAQKVVALLLILAGFELGNNAVNAFAHPSHTRPSFLTLGVALAVMALKWFMYRRQRTVAKKTGSHSLMAQALDSRMDVISSLIASAAIFGAQLGIPHFDALGALAVAILVAWLGIEIFSEAANDLMDRAAPPEVVAQMRETILQVAGVKGISELRTRVSGTQTLIDVKIEVGRHLSLIEAHDISHRVKSALMMMPRVQDVMVHVNPAPQSQNSKESFD
ncbi:MAG: cation transporter [Sulfobacillus benefaciens]|uniref:Cation transporter n=1 Tax=Sulfobacillus benefaciens TaxID=453960 RepID=A0A2T2XHT5_9FIRM|nr:MAG: cation transporter [Sulfobacillus benefaciens]